MTTILKAKRAIKNITQADLTKISGISHQTIHSIESNNYILSTV
jgi:DNA-binding XRE family transcriptional regulator